jgi:hypothetical protein
MKEEKAAEQQRQLKIIGILKTQYWDERFFYSEGIQEVDYNKWDYADTEIIFTGKNYFEYFTDFLDVDGSKVKLHLKNNTIKYITKNELAQIFDSFDLFIVDEYRNISRKKAIKVFLLGILYRKQKYEIEREMWN